MPAILGTNATANKFNGNKVVSIVVGAGTATTTNTADTELINGQIVGIYPTVGTGANVPVNSLVLTASTGVLVITLGGNTTAAQTFNVVVALTSGNIA